MHKVCILISLLYFHLFPQISLAANSNSNYYGGIPMCGVSPFSGIDYGACPPEELCVDNPLGTGGTVCCTASGCPPTSSSSDSSDSSVDSGSSESASSLSSSSESSSAVSSSESSSVSSNLSSSQSSSSSSTSRDSSTTKIYLRK